nr:MAG TPA: hypothetical protein [Caudoviricetes sp.]
MFLIVKLDYVHLYSIRKMLFFQTFLLFNFILYTLIISYIYIIVNIKFEFWIRIFEIYFNS